MEAKDTRAGVDSQETDRQSQQFGRFLALLTTPKLRLFGWRR